MSATGQDEVVKAFMQHKSMLQAYLYSLVEDWHLCDDILQETAVYLCNHWQDYELGSNFAAWARSVARYRCHEQLRKEQKQRILRDRLRLEISDTAWEHVTDPDAERKQALADCVKGLPKKSRKLIEERYYQNKPSEGLAKRLGLSIDALYMSLSRLRRRLKDCVTQKLTGHHVDS